MRRSIFDAVKRGYAEPFAAQYTNWIGMVRFLAAQELAKRAAPAPAPKETETQPASVQPVATPAPSLRNRDVDSDGYLQKRALTDVVEARTLSDRAFALATYFPIPVALLIVLPAAALLVVALVRRNFPLKTEALALLVTTGSSLTLFPQYFFFRPDTPHLSEFMAPFLVAIACAVWLAFQWRRKNTLAAIYCRLLLVLSLCNVVVLLLPRFSEGIVGIDCRTQDAQIRVRRREWRPCLVETKGT